MVLIDSRSNPIVRGESLNLVKVFDMASKKFEYTGVTYLPGIGRRTIKLRETPKYWVCEHGSRWRKSDGLRPGPYEQSNSRLNLESIKRIE